jgi:hypothetical protein
VRSEHAFEIFGERDLVAGQVQERNGRRAQVGRDLSEDHRAQLARHLFGGEGLARTGDFFVKGLGVGDFVSVGAVGADADGSELLVANRDGARRAPALIELVAVLVNETTVNVPLEAVDVGEAGNITDPTTVTQILDPLPDAAWAVTTPAAGTVFGGGAEVESDAVYRARLLQIGTEDNDQRGTLRAILAGVLRVPGVRYATVVEPLNGTVVAFLGDAGYALPLALQQAVRTELLDWRCFGPPLDLRPLTPVSVQVTATIYMARTLENYDAAAITAAAETLVLAYMAARPHPDEYFVEMLAGAIAQAHPEVQHVVLTDPAVSALRPADGTYGSATTINHYRVDAGKLRLTLAPPLTS